VAGWAALSEDQLPAELRGLSASTDLRALLDSDVLRVTDPSSVSDERFRDIVREIAVHLRDGKNLDRDTLARRVDVSAMQAGFSDQAHMSRAFSESFGLTYLDALHAWQHARRR